MSIMRNPVLYLAWGLPAVAVVASVLTLLIVLQHPDGQLPEQYHWEGFQLDRDFSRAARAAELKVHATLGGFGKTGECSLRLNIEGAAPDALVLLLAHSTRPKLDQRVTFHRMPRKPGWHDGTTEYRGTCGEAGEGHWRLELVDAVNGWAVRQTVRGTPGGTTLDAVAGTNE